MPTSSTDDATPNGDIPTFISFLARDEIYKAEKPYAVSFPVGHIQGAKSTNHIFDIKPVMVCDLRNQDLELELDTHGACFLEAKTCLKVEEASDVSTVAMNKYAAEIVGILKDRFPYYAEIQLMVFQVRKRYPNFPHGGGELAKFTQPVTVPHTDFSVHGAFMRMKDVFPGQIERYQDREFDLLNVWKVLKGPNDDWPLAVCDFSSIDWENDTTANDAILPQRTGENWLLHHSDRHRWYYLGGMEEDDLVVLRNIDSGGKRPCSFHVAFYNHKSSSDPRESVELRVVAFRT
ncbi:hypothetical protein NM208_g10338 [Fusarium decemcellulare]|uniref:Uncharacterized protein n=1 Tax=Fusarium decemcellulare TaxID=57161 RepID=A0ACC1RY89_9HYPO|nr:hypothetical protein NM208_g10338 [Fusarium decemcellulare]